MTSSNVLSTESGSFEVDQLAIKSAARAGSGEYLVERLIATATLPAFPLRL